MKIEITFDMPYSLRVEGDFVVNTLGEKFEVNLSTHYGKNPKYPGAQSVENLAMIHDDTNIFSHTKVMRTTADFITSMKKNPRSTEFACHVRNLTSNAVRLEIPFGTL